MGKIPDQVTPPLRSYQAEARDILKRLQHENVVEMHPDGHLVPRRGIVDRLLRRWADKPEAAPSAPATPPVSAQQAAFNETYEKVVAEMKAHPEMANEQSARPEGIDEGTIHHYLREVEEGQDHYGTIDPKQPIHADASKRILGRLKREGLVPENLVNPAFMNLNPRLLQNSTHSTARSWRR